MNSSISFNGDESRRDSTHCIHGSISVISNKKKSRAHSQPQNMPQVHSSAEQNVSYNFETQHHARLKWPTVVIFVVTKQVVDDVIHTPLKQWGYVIHKIIIQTMYKMIYWCLFLLHHGVMFNASRYMWLYVLIVCRGLW